MSAFIFSPAQNVVAGTQSTSVDTFTRIGSFQGGGSVDFAADINTTDAANAVEVRLFDNLAALPVAGSLLSSVSTTTDALAVALVLPVSEYDVQLRLSVSDPAARAVCTAARIEP